MPTRVVRNIHTAIAWNGTQHVTLSGVDVAWQDGALTHVGPAYAGPADAEIDGGELMVMPVQHVFGDHGPLKRRVGGDAARLKRRVIGSS